MLVGFMLPVPIIHTLVCSCVHGPGNKLTENSSRLAEFRMSVIVACYLTGHSAPIQFLSDMFNEQCCSTVVLWSRTALPIHIINVILFKK